MAQRKIKVVSTNRFQTSLMLVGLLWLAGATLAQAAGNQALGRAQLAAQDQPQDQANGKARVAQDVTIIIQPQQVRFIAQKANEEMRLQVFDQIGEVVFDSGALFNTELLWPLRTSGGVMLKSGLYAYALSIKEMNAETTRMRRGHFIVDRAQDRDGAADKLWVTSRSEGDVGVELTIAKDENSTIAGTATRSDNSRDGELPTRGDGEKQPDAKTQKSEAAAPTATVGQIAKFTTATVVGDSVMTEANGNIGIGTTAPANKLDVNGGIRAVFNSSTGMVAETTGGTNAWAQYRMKTTNQTWGIGTSQNFNGNQFYLFDDTYNQTRFTIQPNGGEVAFPSPVSNHVAIRTSGGTNSWAQLRMQTTNQSWMLGTSQNFNGDQLYLVDLTRNQQRMTIQPNGGAIAFPSGNVGIGTTNPTTRLHVESSGYAEATIKSTNERAILVLDNGLGPSRIVWTVESGVRGIPGLFGIYNRTVNKSGLEIDGNLLVYVKALQITGGADFAENFDVSAENHAASAIQPGMVVAIDPANPGKLNLSRRPYDRRVAGIISGAGGVKPGMTMGQEGTLADGKYPVALSGRVYVWVDATRGAIRPGDLLTTSATPGHAMKAGNPARAQGAIIGKAMTELKAGKGLVLVLVTLQ